MEENMLTNACHANLYANLLLGVGENARTGIDSRSWPYPAHEARNKWQ